MNRGRVLSLVLAAGVLATAGCTQVISRYSLVSTQNVSVENLGRLEKASGDAAGRAEFWITPFYVWGDNLLTEEIVVDRALRNSGSAVLRNAEISITPMWLIIAIHQQMDAKGEPWRMPAR